MTRPDADDLPHNLWICPHCTATNSTLDPDCQYCDQEPEMTEPRKLSEFWITLQIQVDALDHEQAQEISRDCKNLLLEANPWNLTAVDVVEVQKA